ncbi:MAG: glycosyltransferase family 2 protein [Candidatus Scalinduaceae bacterium]
MIKNSHNLRTRVAVREVHIEQLESGLVNLEGYQRALVVFRWRGAVVGQAWLSVMGGHIHSERLRACLPSVAWPVWQQLFLQERDSAKSLPTASIVVCTRDRTEELAQCLPGLHKLAEQGHEVIVVDSCPSDDSTARLLANYQKFRYVLEPRPGLNIARNRGLQNSTSEIVAFTDDDAQVDSGWLPALLQNFDDPIVAIVTGITMPLELETEAQQWFEWTNGFGCGFIRKQFDTTNSSVFAAGGVGAGVNMAIRRSAIEHIGLFDNSLDCGTLSRTGGDQEYFYRTLSRGYRIVYEPAALVWHRHRREWSALRNCIYGYGVGLFAWWTRCLLVEKEFTLLKVAPSWFWQHHVRNLVRALLKRPGHLPLDLALSDFFGALTGPINYIRSRRKMRSLEYTEEMSQKTTLGFNKISIPATSQVRIKPLVQNIKVQ